MRRNMKKFMSLAVIGCMVFSMAAGCGAKSSSTSASGDSTDAHYTFQTYMDAPNTWSVCDYNMTSEGNIIGYTGLGLYDFAMNSSKDGYDIVCEMASAMPKDVTSDYAGNKTYGVPANAKSGYAYTITLNKDACWEDGTAINADTYIYSMKQLLNPDMKNYNASHYDQGQFSIANGYGYYCGGVEYSDAYSDDSSSKVSESDMVVSLSQSVYLLGDSMEYYYDDSSYTSYFQDKDGNDLYSKLKGMMNGAKYAPLTDDMKPILTQIAANFGDSSDDAWEKLCLKKTSVDKVSWDKVGLVKNNDYSITFILSNKITPFYMEYNLSSSFLINEKTFEAAKETTGDIVKSTYGTTMENYESCGPWKIDSYQPDKSMHLCKNEKWYGWTDGKHENQYQTTDIDIQFLSKHTTILSLFMQGKLDDVTLQADDMDKYGSSDYVYFIKYSNAYHISMDSDMKSLKSRDGDGVNHSILAYEDFRHALSLSIDRNAYIDECTACADPGYGLLSNSYICDPTTGSLYRDTPQAKQALCDFYQVSSEDDITGYDVTQASKLMQKAYDQCKKDGNITDSDTVQLDFHVSGSDETYVRMTNVLQDSLDKASEGTSLENKIQVNMVTDENLYGNIVKGAIDLAVTNWGGADFDPYSVMWCYCTNEACCEYGFKPTKVKLTITLEGKELTKSYYDWYIALCDGEYASAKSDTRNTILAAMEEGLLKQYTMAPLYYEVEAGLHSQRIIEGSDQYINSMVQFGGLRFMTYSMNDDEWKAYCKEQKNQLTY